MMSTVGTSLGEEMTAAAVACKTLKHRSGFFVCLRTTSLSALDCGFRPQ